jgi:hypothetical protein
MFQENVVLLNDFIVGDAVLVAPADAPHYVLPFHGLHFFHMPLVYDHVNG